MHVPHFLHLQQLLEGQFTCISLAHAPSVIILRNFVTPIIIIGGRSQWPRGLRRRSAAARFLELRVRILPGAWMAVCCECCVLSSRGLCVCLITCPEEFYRRWCVVCDRESSIMRRAWATGGVAPWYPSQGWLGDKVSHPWESKYEMLIIIIVTTPYYKTNKCE